MAIYEIQTINAMANKDIKKEKKKKSKVQKGKDLNKRKGQPIIQPGAGYY